MLNLENLRSGEVVRLVLKRHWIVYIMLFVYFLVGVIISTILFLIIGFGFSNIIFNIVFWLFFSLFLFIEWLNHELDMYVVTNNRIIGVEQISFLNRTVSECNLGQVQEVNSRTKGLFANMINYGTLTIQTAGNLTTMQMEFCPNVIQKAREVLNIVDEFGENIPDKLRRRGKESI